MNSNNSIDYTNKFVYIDENLLKIQKLSFLQMGLMTIIKGLAKDGACFASDRYIGEFLHVSENTVYNNLNKLESMGFIRRINPKSRNRKIIVLESALDRFLREEYNHKNCGDTEKATKTVVIENEMTTKIVVNDDKNLGDTPQNLGTIIINDINSGNIPNQMESNYTKNDINSVTEEPSTESDFHNSNEWRQFLKNALQKIVPVRLLNYVRSVYGASNVKLSRTDFVNAHQSGVDPAVILYAALQCHDKPESFAATLETDFNNVPDEYVNEADAIVNQVMIDAEMNFKKQMGGKRDAFNF